MFGFGIFLVVLAIGAFIALRAVSAPRAASGGAFAGTALLGAVFLLASCLHSIPAGSVGIPVLFGKVTGDPLPPGLQWINPLSTVVNLSTQIQRKDAKDLTAATKDMQAVYVAMSLNFALRPDAASRVYQELGVNYADTILMMAAQEVLKANTARHDAFETLQQRQKIKEDIQAQLTAWLKKYGIDLYEVAITNLTFGEKYTHAIEEKQVQEQLAEQKRYELLQAQRSAEIAAARAKGEADAARERAKGVADALKIEGEAQEEYNRKVSSSITPALLQSQYLKRWDGRLPTFMADGKSILFSVDPQK